MRGIGVHVCEGCGKVYDTIGAYLCCRQSHDAQSHDAETENATGGATGPQAENEMENNVDD